MVVNKLVGCWHSLIAALQLLTRLPVGVQVPFESNVLARSVMFFPMAGLFLGILAAGLAVGLDQVLPAMPAAVILLAIWTALSGGLHLDGWMDTADGLLSHRSRQHMLEIMKDSRVGAMGVLAGVLLLLFKFAVLSVILEAGMNPLMFAHLVNVLICSRLAMSLAVCAWPAARGSEGMAALFAAVKRRHAIAAAALALLASFAVYGACGLALGAAVTYAAAACAAALLVGFIIAWRINRLLGGLTGDCYGAINEAVEAALLLLLVWWIGGGRA